MSVEKFNPRISGELIPYTQVNTHVIQYIDNIEAGFVWVYLLTLPKDWMVIKSHIKKHFGIGDDKIKRIFAYLKRYNLIEYVRERDANGRLRKSEIKVLNGSRFNTPTTGVENHPMVNHTCGKPPTTKDIKNKVNKKKKEYIPHEDLIFPVWLSDESWNEYKQHRQEIRKPLTALAEKKALNQLIRLKEKGNEPVAVIDQTIANGWAGFFEVKQIINSLPKSPTKHNETHSTIKEFGPGHPTWEDQQEWKRTHDSHGSEVDRNNTWGNGVRKAKDYLLS